MVGLEKIHETVVQVEQLQTSLAHKRKELNDKNEEANMKLKQMVHDQQEAEKKRISSQELQVALVVCIYQKLLNISIKLYYLFLL